MYASVLTQPVTALYKTFQVQCKLKLSVIGLFSIYDGWLSWAKHHLGKKLKVTHTGFEPAINRSQAKHLTVLTAQPMHHSHANDVQWKSTTDLVHLACSAATQHLIYNFQSNKSPKSLNYMMASCIGTRASL